jgi:hypothetical protein
MGFASAGQNPSLHRSHAILEVRRLHEEQEPGAEAFRLDLAETTS